MASETHINAYYAEVEEAKKQVLLAESKLNSAEARLHEKKIALGLVQKEEPAEEQADTEAVQEKAKTEEASNKLKKTAKAKGGM